MNRIFRITFFLLTALIIVQSCKTKHKSSETFQNKESKDFYIKAQSFEFKGRSDSALFYFDKADKAAPNTAVIIHERGLLKSTMGKYDEAFLDLDKSIELTKNQKEKEIRFCNRALTYMQMGNMEAACKDWKNSGHQGKSYIEKYCR